MPWQIFSYARSRAEHLLSLAEPSTSCRAHSTRDIFKRETDTQLLGSKRAQALRSTLSDPVSGGLPRGKQISKQIARRYGVRKGFAAIGVCNRVICVGWSMWRVQKYGHMSQHVVSGVPLLVLWARQTREPTYKYVGSSKVAWISMAGRKRLVSHAVWWNCTGDA